MNRRHHVLRMAPFSPVLRRKGSGVAAEVLKRLGGDLNRIRAEIERVAIRGASRANKPGVRPMTPRAARIVESSKQEAAGLNHDFIGTEHLLLALMREVESLPVQALAVLGINAERVRLETLSILGISHK
jgi:ATP-dependent Clp protease ATP-binding subunit ClpC